MTSFAPVFISHGSPALLLGQSAARQFLADWGADLPRPRAILSISAHFETDRPVVVTDPEPEMIYDFYGFPRPLYEIVYPAPGDKDLAEQIALHLHEVGLKPAITEKRGYDHGTWVPLVVSHPKADIPVVQLSIQPDLDPAHHYRLGQALAGLKDEGILIFATGSITHNLREMVREVPEEAGTNGVFPWVAEFADWIADKVAAGDVDALLDYRAKAPHGVRNHPTDEHLLPLFVALGAAGEGARGKLLHESGQHGALRMDAYAFEKSAA
ncbi:MAG: dioxygenase [Hyphomicrobiales bacterium]|nr:MAG: dioxygenase [Hyphomicrobiales bacterium]